MGWSPPYSHAAKRDQNPAPGLNITAFNLGNALGAWMVGVVIADGPGLAALPWTAALLTTIGFAIALYSRSPDRPRPQPLDGTRMIHGAVRAAMVTVERS